MHGSSAFLTLESEPRRISCLIKQEAALDPTPNPNPYP